MEQASQDVLKVEERSLYPALHRMAEAGLIKARWITTENNRRARVYEISRPGTKELDQEENRCSISSAIGTVVKEA
jgi:PadR family transcriptional regulator PadR